METAAMENQGGQGAPSKKMAGYFVAGLACILLLALGGAYAVTRSALKTLPPSETALKAANMLHISVASVNGKKIPYTEFYTVFDTMKVIAGKQPTGLSVTDEQISDQALIQVVGTALMQEIASTLDVSVTEEDVAAGKADFLASNGLTEEDANTEIQKNLGWTFDEYVNRLGRPSIFQQKLTVAFVSSTNEAFSDSVEQLVTARHILFLVNTSTPDSVAKKNAENVIARLKKGEKFEALAKTMGNDENTKSAGGELGTFTRGQMVPAFEEAVFAMQAGTYSQEPVKTEFGYHVIEVLNRRDERSLATYLKEKLKAADIKLLIPLHDPFDVLRASL